MLFTIVWLNIYWRMIWSPTKDSLSQALSIFLGSSPFLSFVWGTCGCILMSSGMYTSCTLWFHSFWYCHLPCRNATPTFQLMHFCTLQITQMWAPLAAVVNLLIYLSCMKCVCGWLELKSQRLVSELQFGIPQLLINWRMREKIGQHAQSINIIWIANY